MLIIKFGGSVITNKAKKGVFNLNTTQKLLVELRKYYDEFYKTDKNSKITTKSSKKFGKKSKTVGKANKDIEYDLILVHGAGSFGHIQAKKYHLDKGYKDKDQLIGLSEVHNDVRDLNLRFLNELLSLGFPGISIPPMVVLRNRTKMISYMDSEIFQKVLDMHCIPVTFGDVVPDESLGFSICSGDSIIERLAIWSHAAKVIFITDVDGLATNNPNLDPNAQLIDELTETAFANACTTQNINPDVTGSIYLKGKIALVLARAGIETYIINGTVPGRFSSALRGEPVTGTVVKAV